MESTYNIGFVKSFFETKSNDFLLSGGHYEARSSSYLARFDTSLRLLWVKDGDSLNMNTPKVEENNSEDIIVAGLQLPESKIKVIKFDKDGELIWQNSYESDIPQYMFSSLKIK